MIELVSVLAPILAPLIVWLIAELTKQTNPLDEHKQRYDQIEKDILNGDLNGNSTLDLEQLERLRLAQSQG